MTANSPPKIGGMLLAAGGSTRFGYPKQLAQFNGESLIRLASKGLIKAGFDPVVVVLGAEIECSSRQIADLHVNTVINLDWKAGMSSSIITGLKALESLGPKLDAVLIALCDQPLITSEFLGRFIAAFKQGRAPIIAADYGHFHGVPALFSRERFHDLYRLTGDKGAREVIRAEGSRMAIPIGDEGLDIDEPDQLAALPPGK